MGTSASCTYTKASCVLSCYYITAPISLHSMNPKQKIFIHSLTIVDIDKYINHIDGLEPMSPAECHTKIQGAAQKTNRSLVEIFSAAVGINRNRAVKCLAAKGQNAYMELAVKANVQKRYNAVCRTNAIFSHECTFGTPSYSGANSTNVTNNCDLAVATPVFPHWVDHGSGSKQKMRWPPSLMSSHAESIMRWNLTKDWLAGPQWESKKCW